MMTRKHYIAVADAIHRALSDYDDEVTQRLVDELRPVFKRDNPAFNSERFFKRCFDGPPKRIPNPNQSQR